MSDKAIGFLKQLEMMGNEDSDGDTFFCKEFDFFKVIKEMINELQKDEIQYICGNCFTPQTDNLPCDENGNCSNCHDDAWIEESDVIPRVNAWTKRHCKNHNISVNLIKYLFK